MPSGQRALAQRSIRLICCRMRSVWTSLLLVSALFSLASCGEKPSAPAPPVSLDAAAEPTAVSPAAAVTSTDVQEAIGASEVVQFTARVTAVNYFYGFTGKVLPVYFDPRFVITVEVLSCINTTDVIFPGETVAFAIHSPSMLFGVTEYVGKTWDMKVERQRDSQGVRYRSLWATPTAAR